MKYRVLSIMILIMIMLHQKIDTPFYPRVVGSTSVQATIGGNKTTMYGYTSPKAVVELFLGDTSLTVIANQSGFFSFTEIALPNLTEEPCIQTKDSVGRLSQPLCLPSITSSSERIIGPIVLPPTVSLSNGRAPVGGTLNVFGQTVPNTNVTISIFSDRDEIQTPFPKINILADAFGNFSLALPTSKSQRLRIFVQTEFNAISSAQSNNLTAEIVPWWFGIYLFAGSVFRSIGRNALTIALVLQLVMIVYIIKKKIPFSRKKDLRKHSLK